jgi:hypothetical protein
MKRVQTKCNKTEDTEDLEVIEVGARFFFFWIHYCVPQETEPHVALWESVLYYMCNVWYEGSNNLAFFSHSKGAIDMQCIYKELVGTACACQMTVMLVITHVLPGLLSAFISGCAELAHAMALQGEKRRECGDAGVMVCDVRTWAD